MLRLLLAALLILAAPFAVGQDAGGLISQGDNPAGDGFILENKSLGIHELRFTTQMSKKRMRAECEEYRVPDVLKRCESLPK